MTRTTLYIFKQLTAVFLMIAMTLVGVIWLTQSLRFVDLIINKGVPIGTFLYMAALLLPGLFVVVLPISLFCAVIFAYHRLNVESEIVVLRAAGLSQMALARPALIMASLVMAITFALTLYVAPAGYRESMNLRFAIRTDFSLILLQEGVFNSVVNGITVYVRERLAGGELLGILVYDDRDKSKPVTMMAERGALLRTDEGPRFLLLNGNRQQMTKDRTELSLLYFDEYVLNLRPYVEEKGTRWREPQERYLPELFGPPNSASDKAYVHSLRTEGHRRIATPLASLAFALIALATILSGEFNRRGNWLRLIVGVGAAIGFEASTLGLVHLVETLPALWPILYAVPVVVMAASVYVIVAPPRRWAMTPRIAREAR